jgi:peptide/nickel transport system substrate-binding protein
MKKVTRRDFLRLSSVAAAGVAVAACAKTAEPTTPPEAKATATTKPAAEKATATPVAEVVWPRGQVPRNRTVVRMFTAIEGNVNKASAYAGETHQDSSACTYEAMFYYTATNDKTYNHLAESYEYNDDATELTVYLRKGVEWSDGSAFTANDIAFTYNTLVERAPDYSNSARVATLLDEAVAVDDHTVKFMLKNPNFRFHFTECTFRMDRGNYLVPEKVYKDVADWREFGFHYSENPDWPLVTAGYKLSEDTVDHRHYDRRDDWWAFKTGFMDLPEPERIVHIPHTDDTQAAELIINNEIDESLDMRPRLIETVMIRAPHVTTFSGREKPYGYTDWWPISMYFNCVEEPYTDPRVRWAMAYAVDQLQLVEVGYVGAGKPTAHFYPEYPGLLAYIESISDILEEYNPLEVDLEKSADLMVEAGFEKDSEGFWVKGGQRFDCDIWAGVPLFGDIAPITAEQLRKGGFDSNHVTPPDVWDGKGDGRAMLHFFGHGGSVKDPFTTLDMYHIRNQKPTGENCGDNRPRWGNQEYSDIVDELSKISPDDPATFDLFHDAMAIWYKELPEVPLVQWHHRTPWNTTYWTGWPSPENPYNTSMWHLTMPIMLWNLKATT